MGAIYLIRHAQASFGKAEYDALSDTGRIQAGVLARYLNRHIQPHMMISGQMQRHRDTAHALFELAENQTLPSIIIDRGFDEFDHVDVLQQYDERYRDQAVFRDYLQQHENPRRAFEQLFSASITRWVGGEHDHHYRESWPQFRIRVIKAVENLLSTLPRSQNVLVFTSGGPISVVCQWLLNLGKAETFTINANLANGGITRLLYSGDRVSLSYLNNYSHFERVDPAMVTFR